MRAVNIKYRQKVQGPAYEGLLENILRILIEHGVPDAVVAQVARMMADANQYDRARSQNAARQQNYRNRVTLRNVSNVTDPSKVSPTTPLNTPPRSEPYRVLRSLPADFSPDIDFAAYKGFPREKAVEEAQRFRDYALAHDKKYRDWDAAWRNWLTSPYQEKGKSNGKPTVHDAAKSQLDKLRALDDPIPSGLRNGAGESPVRLLSSR
jgi:hypothetical protein